MRDLTLFQVWLKKLKKEDRNMALMGIAAFLWTIWKFRNAACFENKKLTDPFVLIRMVGMFLNDWTILQRNLGKQEELKWAVKLVEKVASEILHEDGGWE
jgi:hypothetical protein